VAVGEVLLELAFAEPGEDKIIGFEAIEEAADRRSVLASVRRREVEEKKVAAVIGIAQRPPERGRADYAGAGRHGLTKVTTHFRVIGLPSGGAEAVYPRPATLGKDQQEAGGSARSQGKPEAIVLGRPEQLQDRRRHADAEKRHDQDPVDVELQLVEKGELK